MIAVILPVAGSARASPDGVSTHTALGLAMICGTYPPLSTGRLCSGVSESWLIKVTRSAPVQPIQMPCGPATRYMPVPRPGSGPS